MRTPLTVTAAGRRYAGLTALRWLPVGLSTPVTVLPASARGLSPVDIGVVSAVHSTVVLVLELPTGGLADSLGTRPVLVLSGVFGTAGLLGLTVADGVAAFALAEALRGVGRALDAGPLEAWYVDTVRAADPEADVAPACPGRAPRTVRACAWVPCSPGCCRCSPTAPTTTCSCCRSWPPPP